MSELGTIVTAAVTPFGADGEVDSERWRELVTHLYASGSDAVVVAGTTGESPTLSADEVDSMTRIAVEIAAGKPVIVGTGSYSTSATIAATQRAAAAGASAALVVTPYYNKPPRDGLLAHFLAVADASPIPIVLYNIPARVILNLDPELVAELAQHEEIVALKQAQTEDLDETRRIRELAPDLAIYAGNDDALLPLLELGAVGGICVASHIVGAQMGAMAAMARAGELEAARNADRKLKPVYAALSVTTNPIPVKAALDHLGLPGGGPLRLPLVAATDAQRHEIATALDNSGVTATIPA